MLAFTAVCVAIRLAQASASAIFQWPNPQLEYIDDLIWGNTVFLPAIAGQCSPRENTTIAAQWVRIAYHDMANHNVDDGTGGIDASIMYELDRPQNVGRGMHDSLNDFTLFTTPYVGFADLIAAGLVFAVVSCGGPVVPFRAGRIDTNIPGPATVPEPQQDLASHIESFRRQGFTQSEMIALVACGHAFGGVRQVDFPEIVPADQDFATFSSEVGFHNLVVRQYLDGSTENPLVAGANKTTNSDLRIFSSDGNVTMQSLSSVDTFTSTCKNLLERMINTVPKSVKLTEPVDPIDLKVSGVQFYATNNSYVLNTNLRFNKENSNRTVKMFWKEARGSVCPSGGCSVDSSSLLTRTGTLVLQKLGSPLLSFHRFAASIDFNTSASHFWYQVDEHDGSAPYTVDNHGHGYQLDDTVLFDPSQTTFIILPDFSSLFQVYVAVKNANAHTKVTLESYHAGNSPTFLPIIEDIDMQLNQTSNGYTYYTANISTTATGIHVKTSAAGKQYNFYVRSDDWQIFR